MFKVILFLLSGVFLSQALLAQNTIRGRVLDEDGKPLGYTSVVLLNQEDSAMVTFAVTDPEGQYAIKSIKDGKYLLQYSFVGMVTLYRSLEIPREAGETLEDVVLSISTLSEVVIEAETVPIQFKKDTLEFNVNTFQTRPGASVEELLEKLPGVEVDETGDLQAQGEKVVKVLVNGKEYFGKDPKVATKNLPAKALEKVQVFDRKSEAAAFSGIDDGVRDRTINLVLRKTYESRYFGNLAAGGGTGKTAKVEGKLNRFSKTVQASVMNMYNNINEFGFTDNANRPYGQGIEGLNTNLSGGANFLYNPRGENRYFVSYLGSITRKILDEFTSTENYLPTGVYHQTLDLVKEERVEPHHINAGIRHSFNDMNRLILDGNIVFNQTGIQSLGFMNTDLTDRRINSLENKVDDSNKNKQYNGSLAYISKFNEEKTQLQLNMNGLYKKDDSFLNWSNDTFLYDSMKREFIEQMRNNELEEVFASINPTLVQKLDDSWILSASGHLGLNNENLYRKEGILNTDGSVNEQVFPDFSANESFFRPSMSLQHSSEKLLINLSLEGVFNQFDRIFSGTMIGTHYARFLPRFRFRNEYKSGRRLEATYHTTLKMPSANQLFPVPNKLNQLAIITGNMALRPEYFHDVNLTWSLFDETTFRALFVRIGGKYARDKISWSQTIREDLINIISPVNVPIDYSVDSYMNFSSPIRSLKLKANATWQEIWNRNMTYINTLENINTLLTHVVDLNLENQKKEKWNLKIGGTARVTNSGFSVADSKTYYFINTDYYTSIRFIPAKQWSFETNATIRSYASQSFDKAVTIPLVTARMGYFFLADQRASFTLDGFDLLNTYVGFQRLSVTNFLMQREWNTISQYVMLTFSLRFL